MSDGMRWPLLFGTDWPLSETRIADQPPDLDTYGLLVDDGGRHTNRAAAEVFARDLWPLRTELTITARWPPRIAGYLWAQPDSVQRVPLTISYREPEMGAWDLAGWFQREDYGVYTRLWQFHYPGELRFTAFSGRPIPSALLPRPAGSHVVHLTAPPVPARLVGQGFGLDSDGDPPLWDADARARFRLDSADEWPVSALPPKALRYMQTGVWPR